jgi:hypothetical protein
VGFDFFYYQNPTKIILTEDLPLNKDFSEIYKSIPIMIYYPMSIEPVNYVFYNQSIGKYNIIDNNKSLNQCLDQQIKDFNETKVDTYSYICIELSFGVEYFETPNYVYFGLESCLSRGNCANTKIDQINYGIALKRYNFELNADKNEFKNMVISSKNISVPQSNLSNSYYSFKLNANFYNWTEDTNMFVIDNSNFQILPFYNPKEDIKISQNPMAQPTFDVAFEIYLNPEITIITRTFSKIIITLKKTLYVCALFHLFLEIFNCLFSEYFFLSILRINFLSK